MPNPEPINKLSESNPSNKFIKPQENKEIINPPPMNRPIGPPGPSMKPNRPAPPRPSGNKVPVPSSLSQPRVEDINPPPASFSQNDASMSSNGVVRKGPQPPTRPPSNQHPPANNTRTQPIQQEISQGNLFC